MGKAIGIDYGTKRTGIAITDLMQIIASPLTTVPTHKLDTFIAEIVERDNISCFVIGSPINLDGSKTNVTSHIDGFIKRLKNKYSSISTHRIDERFSSKIARKSILLSGAKKTTRQNRMLVDKVSATIILQDYLDTKS